MREMDIKVKQLALVINRMRRDALPESIAQLQAETGATIVSALPDDEDLARLSEDGGRLQDLPASNRVVAAMDRLLFESNVPTNVKREP